MKRILFGAVGCAMLLALPEQVVAGAWTQSERGYYLKLPGLSFTTTEELDPDGESMSRVGEGG